MFWPNFNPTIFLIAYLKHPSFILSAGLEAGSTAQRYKFLLKREKILPQIFQM